MSTPDPGPRLLGRRSECAALDELVASVRAGPSRALVLRGEAGVGKTALLEYLVAARVGLRASRGRRASSPRWSSRSPGCTSSARRSLDRLERLPGPQRDALGTAFGLRDGDAPDRFLVGLAVLSLLSDVAEERPLVCVVDDAQWLDGASAQALAFVARRLGAESVGLVFAVREPAGERHLDGLPELVVGGLDDARRAGAAGVGDRRPARRAGARPDRGRDARQPAGAAGAAARPDARRAGGRVRAAGGAGAVRADRGELPAAAGGAAAGDAAAAAGRGGRAGRRSAAGVAGGRPRSGSRPTRRRRRRRPAWSSSARRCASGIRSCARRSTGRRRRRSASASTARWPRRPTPSVDPDRRAWHRAQATAGLDEDVAAELERSAGRARARGGLAAAAAFLERAAELTPDPARRAQRALAAAQGKHQAGAPDAALRLLAHGARRDRSTSSSARGRSCCARRSRSPRRAAATLLRCCSRRPSGSSRSTRRSRARPTSTRSPPRCPPTAWRAAAMRARSPRRCSPPTGSRSHAARLRPAAGRARRC